MAHLNRIYDDYAYDVTRSAPSYWEATVAHKPNHPALASDLNVDVAIIGGGYTGLSTAKTLAQDHDIDVAVFEAGQIGWGASGRNGGFCGFGGTKLSDAQIIARFGEADLKHFYEAQSAAIDLVRANLAEGIDADPAPEGEICLAHMDGAKGDLLEIAQNFDRFAGLHCPQFSTAELRDAGFQSAAFHGGVLMPKAFGLHPLKYVQGLARQTETAGAKIFAHSAITQVQTGPDGRFILTANGHQITADRIVIATNGYSSENLPDWMRGRYLPVVSHIMVTRPLGDDELAEQGWTSHQLAYDTRTLLHYFRLLPDKRMLFGMRGTSNITPASEKLMKAQVRADFDQVFPAWTHVETAYHWNGLVSLNHGLTPYIGPLGELKKAYAAFGYHGSGVALATYSGQVLADLVAGQPARGPVPKMMQTPPGRYTLARVRRHYLPLAYLYYSLRDRL